MDSARKATDPRNDDDYDTWDAGMEPLPGDRTWTKQAALAQHLERIHEVKDLRQSGF